MAQSSHSSEKVLLTLTVVLSLFGLIMLASAGVIYAQTRFDSQYFFVLRQLLGVGVGFVLLLLLRRIDYHIWQKLSLFLFIVAIGFLILIFVPGIGTKVYGATRWISLGPISFQPSELIKLTLILYLSAWFATKNKTQIYDIYETLVPFTGIIALLAFLIIKQPDIGTFGLITLIAGVIYFVAGAKFAQIGFLLASGVGALFLLIQTAPYRMARFLVFLHPETDPQGIGYQIKQALIAVGSGEIVGRGLGHSMQKFNYLPEVIGDSIFAVISEELGFVGACVLLVMFAVFAFYGYRVAQNAQDTFGRLVATGITTWIILQALINIAAIIALMPLTGMPLPFISYGSTSLVIILASVGILLNIARQGRVRS